MSVRAPDSPVGCLCLVSNPSAPGRRAVQLTDWPAAAPEFEGYLKGAVRAADRAVTEVLDLI